MRKNALADHHAKQAALIIILMQEHPIEKYIYMCVCVSLEKFKNFIIDAQNLATKSENKHCEWLNCKIREDKIWLNQDS